MRNDARDFTQIVWDERLKQDCRDLVRLAIREDVDRQQDWTTVALVPSGVVAAADIVSREEGVIAGLPAAALALAEYDASAQFAAMVKDGDRISPGTIVARIQGPARSLLTAERVLLNLLGRLSGIATLTSRYVSAVQGTKARVYDTRKTTPGWRRLEKYAVRQGGGCNHRTGLFDAILIKDNHLAYGQGLGSSPAEAVIKAREFVSQLPANLGDSRMLIEVEVDNLEQLQIVLGASPDIVLLDNMSLDDLKKAVQLRDQKGLRVELEASGGVRLETIARIAHTGVDRISVGALTHSAIGLDLGLDWENS